MNGCDFETDFLNLAMPELVKVTAITPSETSTEIAFVWKWNATDLGKGLRQDGKLYSMLTPAQVKNSAQCALRLPEAHATGAGEDFTGTGSVRVKKDANGWGPA